jgi:hypothetical protein
MQLSELVIMSSGVNQFNRFLLLRLGAINICQSSRFCNQISVAGTKFYRRYLLVSLFQFAFIGNAFTFKITTMNIGMHYLLTYLEELELAVR